MPLNRIGASAYRYGAVRSLAYGWFQSSLELPEYMVHYAQIRVLDRLAGLTLGRVDWEIAQEVTNITKSLTVTGELKL